MELAELITRLTQGDGRVFSTPMAPYEASELIVSTLLPDLPKERRDAVQKAIAEWSGQWADLVGRSYQEE